MNSGFRSLLMLAVVFAIAAPICNATAVSKEIRINRLFQTIKHLPITSVPYKRINGLLTTVVRLDATNTIRYYKVAIRRLDATEAEKEKLIKNILAIVIHSDLPDQTVTRIIKQLDRIYIDAGFLP